LFKAPGVRESVGRSKVVVDEQTQKHLNRRRSVLLRLLDPDIDRGRFAVHGAGSVVGFVVLLVLGIGAIQAAIWAPIIIRFRRRSRAAQQRLSSELAAESVIRPPEKASYEGATAPNFPRVANSGVIALSKRRLVFITVTGKVIEIPVSEIRGVHDAKVFKRAVRGGKTHLVIEVPAGEVGFYVSDNAAWRHAIKSVCAQ